jgi:hypothetical protein
MITPKCDNSAWKNFLRHVPLIVKYIKDPENLNPLDRYVILGAYRAGLSGVPPYAYEVGGKMFDSPMIFLAWNCGDDLRRTEDLRRFGYLKPWGEDNNASDSTPTPDSMNPYTGPMYTG